jgi:hypothetical protein
VNEGGVWRLIDRDSLAKLKLEDLREVDLEPIAKWLSTWHEDLVKEVLEELAGLRGKEARKHYMDHGLKRLIETLDWSYEEILKENRKDLELGKAIFEKILKETINVVQGESELKKTLEESKKLLTVIEVKPEEIEVNLLIFVGERLKNALKPFTNCWRRAALIIGLALAGYPLVPKLPEGVIKSLGDDLRRCDIDNYLLIGNRIPPLILVLVHVLGLSNTIAFVDRYKEIINEVNKVFDNAKKRKGIYSLRRFMCLV